MAGSKDPAVFLGRRTSSDDRSFSNYPTAVDQWRVLVDTKSDFVGYGNHQLIDNKRLRKKRDNLVIRKTLFEGIFGIAGNENKRLIRVALANFSIECRAIHLSEYDL